MMAVGRRGEGVNDSVVSRVGREHAGGGCIGGGSDSRGRRRDRGGVFLCGCHRVPRAKSDMAWSVGNLGLIHVRRRRRGVVGYSIGLQNVSVVDTSQTYL
jgi:hypothetical protein